METETQKILARAYTFDPNIDFRWIVGCKTKDQVAEMVKQLKIESLNLSVLTGKTTGKIVSPLQESDLKWIRNYKMSAFYNPRLSAADNLENASKIALYLSKNPDDIPTSIKDHLSIMGSKEIQNRAYKTFDLERDEKGRKTTGIGKIFSEEGQLVERVRRKSLSDLKHDTESAFPLTYTGNFLTSFQSMRKKQKSKNNTSSSYPSSPDSVPESSSPTGEGATKKAKIELYCK